MSTKYPGGIIRKTPPTITPPVDGEGGSAPGVWTLEQASYYTKTGVWPQRSYNRQLYAFGRNQHGNLGQNDLVFRSSPVQVGALTDWKNIYAALNAFGVSLATKNNGTLWSWGDNNQGQLGQNDKVNRSSPVQIGALTTWVKTACANGGSFAINNNNSLWGWGLSTLNGLNSNVNSSSPVQVGALNNWKTISVSYHASSVKTDGTIWSWGTNVDGGLGQNDLVARSSPTQIGSSTDWKEVSVGDYFTIAIKTNGTLWSWGKNNFGQLGQNDQTYRSSPVQIGALTTWNYISCGTDSALSIKTDGTLWVWGRNTRGKLGKNNVNNYSSPTQIGALTTWSIGSMGGTFAAATQTDGTLWSWGDNSDGQLGQNISILVYRSSPTQIGSNTTWEKPSCGLSFALVTTKY